MEDIRIRPYKRTDEFAAMNVWLRSWKEMEEFRHIDFGARLWAFRKKWIDSIVPVAQIRVAEISGEIAGVVTIEPQICYLEQLFVAPEYKGRGVGEALINVVKRLSPGMINLAVNERNPRAVAFYLKHGFAQRERYIDPISGEPILMMIWKGGVPRE